VTVGAGEIGAHHQFGGCRRILGRHADSTVGGGDKPPQLLDRNPVRRGVFLHALLPNARYQHSPLAAVEHAAFRREGPESRPARRRLRHVRHPD
jgi:hypothetical protein